MKEPKTLKRQRGHIEIDDEDMQLWAIVLLISFIGWMFWETVFWVCRHVYVAWV